MQDIYKQAIQLQNKFRDYIDDQNHALARELSKDIQRLTDEIEMQKNALSLRDRVKGIIRTLEKMDETIMDNRHIDDLRDRCMSIDGALR